MDYFTQEDHDWFKRVQEMPNKYKIVIDDDSVWVEQIGAFHEEIPYTFNNFGYEFIYALLNDMGINAEMC
jgi:hypothetical protein